MLAMEVKSKPWYESTTTWGIAITVISGALALFGVNVGADATSAVSDSVPAVIDAVKSQNWTQLITTVFSIIGVIVTTIGRVKAAQPIHFVKPYTVNVDAATVAKPAS